MESLLNLYRSIFPPRAVWSTKQIPSLAGKVALVTGGNAGIGKLMTRELVAHKASRVYVLCRSVQKGEEAVADIEATTGVKGVLRVVKCDLADLASVKAAATEVLAKESQIHLLFNNAGVMGMPITQLTKQGYDLTFGTNVLGHAYLTRLLLPTMISTAKSSPAGSVRVVTTASSAHWGAPPQGILYDTISPSPARDKKASPTQLYYQSKWANIVYSKELARRYGAHGVVCGCVDPGWLKTDLWREEKGWSAWIISFLLSDPEFGALTPLYAGTSPEAGSLNGGFFVPWARPGAPRKDAADLKAGEKLWEWCEGELKAQGCVVE